MLFKQLFDTDSSTYTYFISDIDAGEAVLIDPVDMHIDEYLHLLNTHKDVYKRQANCCQSGALGQSLPQVKNVRVQYLQFQSLRQAHLTILVFPARLFLAILFAD